MGKGAITDQGGEYQPYQQADQSQYVQQEEYHEESQDLQAMSPADGGTALEGLDGPQILVHHGPHHEGETGGQDQDDPDEGQRQHRQEAGMPEGIRAQLEQGDAG